MPENATKTPADDAIIREYLDATFTAALDEFYTLFPFGRVVEAQGVTR